MSLYRVTEIATDSPHHCTIGYTLPGSVPILCYDALVTLLCAAIFIKCYSFPNIAQQTSHQASSLKIMAKRNIIGSIVACLTATINYAIMIALEGRERGLVALSISTLVNKICWKK